MKTAILLEWLLTSRTRIDPWQSSEDSEKDNTYTDPANGTSTSVPDVLPPPPVSSKLDSGSRIDPWQSSEDSEKDNTYTDPTIA